MNKKGDITEFMGVNLIKLVLLAMVIGAAVWGIVQWRLSVANTEMPARVKNTFDRLSTVMDRVHDTNMTSYTMVNLIQSAKIIFVPTNYPDKEKRKDCKLDENCVCVAMPGNTDDYEIVRCKSIDYNINIVTSVKPKDSEEFIQANNCVAKDMYYCRTDIFTSKDKYKVAIYDVKVSREFDGVKVSFVGTVT
jgi:hypothetical protein